MVSLEAMIPAGAVLLDVAASDKSALLGALVAALGAAGLVQDSARFLADLQQREALGSTGLGLGCAVPHAHSPALGSNLVAFARPAKGLDFAGPDGEPVRLVFLLAGPPDNPGLHLKLLSKVARLLHDGAFREALLAAPDEASVRALLKAREQ